MPSFKTILTDIAKAIVEHPDEVVVSETEDGDNITLVLSVSESDMGKVIGRNGRIARAIRLLIKSSANTAGKRVNVEIR